MKRIVQKLSLAAAVACVSFVASAQTYRVTADAKDGGGGLSWASAMTLSNAIAAVTADGGDGTILIQAGAYPVSAPFDVTSPMTIRGGYAGTDDTTLAADPYTTFDGSNKVERIFNVTTDTSENDYNRFSHCIFKRCAQQNFKKSGLGSLEAEDCAFLESVDTKGSGKADGWGGCFTGTAGKSKLALRRCLFAGNRTTYNAYSEGNVKGMGAYIGNFASAALVDCQFVTNGIALGVGYGSRPYSRQWGAALYVTSAPLAMTNTTFKLNRGLEFGDWGSVIYIAGSSGGSVFDHCLFIANESVGQDTSKLGGTLEIASGNAAHAYLFNHCTFAWNLSARSASTPAGLFVATGTATIRNCIFAGNIASTHASVGTDLHVGSGGKAIVSYTSFGGEGRDYVSSDKEAGLDFTGGGIRYGDPLFASPLGSVTDYLASTTTKAMPKSTYPVYYSSAKMRDILALDAHLLSTEGHLTNDDTNTWRKAESDSPCIDSGSPDAPYAEEPTPNGKRVNLGCFGNTAQASKTVPSVPGIDGEISVTYPFGYSQPKILFTLGGTGTYKANVTVKVSADGGETWAATRVENDRKRGEMIVWFVPQWFERGTTLKVVVTLDSGAETVEEEVTSEVTLDPPPGGRASKVLRVRPDATGTGDGTSWSSATTLADAISLVTADGDGTILIQAGAYPVSAPFDISTPMTIRGGYAGTDDTTLAADPYTTFDGSNNVARIFNITTATSENDYNRFSRCIFKRCVQQNFKKEGLGSLEAEDCAFLESVCTKGSGKEAGWGGRFVGTAGKSKLALRRCLFAGNRVTTGAYSEESASGMGAFISGFASAALVDCQFVTNGIALGVGYSNQRPYSRTTGYALYVNNAPLAMTNTIFRLNRALEFVNWGSVIYITGASGGSVFDHCLFIANENVGCDSTTVGGTMEIASGNAAHAYLFNHCTFAWNLSARSASTPAGLFVATGTATIRNCIFAGNIASTSASVGVDLHVGSGGKAIVSYTSFGGEGAVYASSSSAAGLDFTGGGIRYGDPLFVSPLGSVTNYLSADTTTKAMPLSSYPVYYSAAKMRDILALDAHLLSSEGYLTNDDTNTWRKAESHSPCIDSGDPDAPYAEEPTPNGNHANLGCYGNTAQASKTASGRPGVDGEVSVTYPFGYSQPRIFFTLGGEGVYKAKVTIKVSADDGATWAATRVEDGRMRGETVEWFVPEWFEKGATLKVVVSVDGGSETIEAVVASEVTVDPPPQGGDASKVIHVRPDAKGRGDGTSWFHAMTDLHAAIRAAQGTTNEIWAAGNYLMTADATGLNPSVDIVVRGGFAGDEASPEERQEGCRTTIDGQSKRTPLNFENANAVTLERIALTNAVAQSVVKTGGGDMTLRECLVAGNKKITTGLIGSFTGASGAVLRFEDCDFADDNIGSNLRQVNGGAITAKTFARVEVLNCRFLRVGNGQLGTDGKWTTHGDQVSGSVIYAENAPLTVCGTSFVGCHNENGGGFGGLVVVKGAASKCAFTNCLWCACEDIYSGYLDTEDRAGALVLDLANAGVEADIVNCTFAWNLADARRSPAALNVIRGAAKVRSTIFHNSITSVTTTCGCDIDVKAGSSVDVAWSHFDREGTVTKQDETATIVPGEGLKYGDPGLVSEDAPVNSRVKDGGSYGFKNTIRSLVAGLNAHLRGGSGYRNEKSPHELVTDFAKRGFFSSALDTGDPSVKCVEPRPNGHCVNMGCYGNTPWATRSKHGGALIVR